MKMNINIKKNPIIRKIQSSNLLTAFLINIFFLCLVLLFCDMKYEVSDDFVMAAILSGAYGNGSNPQMIFVNVIIGYLNWFLGLAGILYYRFSSYLRLPVW